MTFRQQTILGFYEALVDASIETLRLWNPAVWWRSRQDWVDPYWGCFSGGKDSCVIKELAREAGVPVEWHYSVTTIDPPELTAFIKREHPDVIRDKPERSFNQLVATKGTPTRRTRWCCELLKESRAERGRRMILGVRAAESPRRAANWQTFTFHRKNKESAVLPILHWRTDDVWRFIRQRGLAYCRLYDEGHKRLGCIGCPMSRGSRVRDFARWPHIASQIKKAARIRWEAMTAAGSTARTYQTFATFEAFWQWWLSDEPMPGKEKEECQGQLEFWS